MALHPVMTFTGRPDDLDRLDGISFGVTAPEPVLPAAEALVIEMGGEPVVIDEADRALYHAGLASAANHLVALVAQSADLLRAAGVAEPSRMLGAAAVRRPGQRAAARRRRADRAGGPRRRGHRGRAHRRAP